MKRQLSPNATIADVVPTLSNPEEYVRVVVSTMHPCHQRYGNANVRIGITGEGKMPFHKISFVDAEGKEEIYGAYSGNSVFEDVKIHQSTWSNTSTPLEEVRDLLGSLRGWKGEARAGRRQK